MRRDVVRLRRVAELFAQDLRRALGNDWQCSVDAHFMLTVEHGHQEERVLLDDRVAEDNWPAEAWERYLEATLDDDASEAIAQEIFEVLRLWNERGPVCHEHDTVADVCGMMWYCGQQPGHDLAEVGRLGV